MKTLMLLEDDDIVAERVKKQLSESMTVLHARSIKTARDILVSESIDFFVVDLGLPDGFGLQFCHFLRAQKEHAQTPVFVLTSNCDMDQKIFSFSSGADDYITKPFDVRELEARIQRRLLTTENKVPSEVITTGNLQLDRKAMNVTLERPDGTSAKVDLTPTEYKILNRLLAHEGEWLATEDLKKDVWGRHIHTESSTLYSHISRLKQKLGAEGKRLQSRSGRYSFQQKVSA